MRTIYQMEVEIFLVEGNVGDVTDDILAGEV